MLKADKKLAEEAVADISDYLKKKVPLEIKEGIGFGLVIVGFGTFENRSKQSWRNMYKAYLASEGYVSSNFSQAFHLFSLHDKISENVFEKLSPR